MGKQSKRKTRRGRSSQQNDNGPKRQKSQNKPSEEVWRPRVDLSKASKRDRNIILKIRHNDARVRDGALSALSMTLFSGSGVSKISNEILQATTERLAIDSDVPSSCAAAGCLVNFLESSDENCDRLLHHVAHVNIMYLLSNRISRILVESSGEGHQRSLNAEWNVTYLCLQILVTLVESGLCSGSHEFVDPRRISPFTEPKSLLQVVVQTLMVASEVLESTESQKSIMISPDADLNKNDAVSSSTASKEIVTAIERCVELCSRFLHSVSDSCGEEVEESTEMGRISEHAVALSVPIYGNKELSAGRVSTIQVLQKLLENKGKEWVSPKTSLHAAGALVSLRASLLQTDREGDAATNLDSTVMEVVLPYLSTTVKNTFNAQIAGKLSQKVIEKEAELRRETDDLDLESKAESAVKQRNEPARLIARRQKQQKEEKGRQEKTQEEANKVSDSEMGDIPEEKRSDKKPGHDTKQEYEKAVEDWMSYTLPLLLCLEVLANLTSCSGTQQSFIDNDEDMAWASDDEDKLEAMVIVNNAEETEIGGPLPTLLTTKDEALLEKVASLEIPEQILSLLESTLTFSARKDNNKFDEATHIPDVVLTNVMEIKSKGAACLGNILTNMSQQLWRPSKEQCLDLWARFMNTLREELDAASKFAVTESDVDGYDHISVLSRTLLALMQTRGHLVAESVNEADLELLLVTLTKSDSNILECRQNIVIVLGELCSRPHSNAVNERICKALLSALKDASAARKSMDDLLFVARLLDVLIDIYADDDAFRNVFEGQGVLIAFDEALPILRRGIKELNKKKVDEEDKSYLRKTSLNVGQFIKYKKEKTRN